jgi:predicted nucleic acid-binding protein
VIVVDAGVWVRSLIDDGSTGDAARRVLAGDLEWTAPAHAPIEALRTVRRYETAGFLSTAQAQLAAAEVLAAQIDYVGPERWLLVSVWRHRHNLSAYDAPYVVIAQSRGIPLVTLDRRLERAATAAGVPVVVPTG